MKKLNHAISWFEIPANDLPRARKFYETIFDIEMINMEIGDNLKFCMFPTEDNTIGGSLISAPGFYKPAGDGSLVYLNANPDLQAVLSRVEGAGGKIVVPKTQISPEYGYMAVFTDSEGNRVALHSAS